MKNRKVLSMILAAALAAGSTGQALAAYENTPKTSEVSESERLNLEDSIRVAAESIVLLENNGLLPMDLSGRKIALYGMGARNTIMGGLGSGAVPAREVITVYQALKDRGVEIPAESEAYLEASGYLETIGGFNGPGGTYDVQSLPTEETVEIGEDYLSEETDTAIYVLPRLKGEGNEHSPVEGDYYLSALELANVKTLASHYEHFLFVYNATAMDSSFLQAVNEEIPEGIDAVVALGSAGQGAGEALARVLSGEVTPSGKLVTTWANIYDDYPASETFSTNDGDTENEIYEEGIYVGYRYFDTFGKDVSYPFGYGLSYTSFETEVTNVEADQNRVTLQAEVTNTGSFAGKEVVQVYFSAPNDPVLNRLDKPFQELIAYGKTDLLQPGGSQTLTLSFLTAEMSSYDEDLAAYILEDGDYVIRVGNSSRNTKIAAVLTLDTENGYQITEQLSNHLETRPAEETRDNKNETGYLGDHVLSSWEEEAAGPVFDTQSTYEKVWELSLDFTGYEVPVNISEYEDHVVTTYVSESNQENFANGLYWGEALKAYDSSLSDVTAEHAQTVAVVPDTPEGTTLRDVLEGRVSMESFAASLTLLELSQLAAGYGGYAEAPDHSAVTLAAGACGFTTNALEETRGVPATDYADGPSGARLNRTFEYNGETYYQYVTCIPAGSVYSQSWDAQVMELAGDIIGRECEQYGVTYILGPGLNIIRDPLCGRIYEYYSEDPVICGNSGTSFIHGVQKHKGVTVSPKHFAGNNQENSRTTVNSSATERTWREIYLKGFEMLVKAAAPGSLMTSYNLLNGVEASENYDLVTNILRGEWGYNGLVEVDWGGSNKAMQTIASGNDSIQPGDGAEYDLYYGIADVSSGVAYVQDDGTLYAGAFNLVAGGEEAVSRDFDTDFEVPESLYVTTEINGMDPSGNYFARKFESEVSKGTCTIAFVDAEGNETLIADDTAEEGVKMADISREDYEAIRISYWGTYDRTTYIHVGDLQRAAMDVLHVIMNSNQMAELHEGVEPVSYTEYLASPAYESLRTSGVLSSPVKGENGLIEYIAVEKSETAE